MLSSSSSDSDSDSDCEQNRRLRSVAVDSSTVAIAASCASKVQTKLDCNNDASASLTLYQIRARSLLQEYLDRTYEMDVIKNNGNVEQNVACSKDTEDDAGFCLFRCAPPGISFKFSGEAVVSRKRGRELKDNDCDESSKTFEARLLAAAIDGATVKARAEKAITKSICSWLSNEAAEREAQKIEEERVALLKRQRGEEWLPSVARKMAMDMLSDAGSGACRENVELQKLCNVYRSEETGRLFFQLQTTGEPGTSTSNDCKKGKEGKVKKENIRKDRKVGSANV